jgi:outer membrane protein
MKNLSLIINAVLAVCIAVLFYFQFAEREPEARKNTVDAAVIDSVSATLKIAYVNHDSLMANYKLVDDIMAELDVAKKKSERKVEQRNKLLSQQLEQMMGEYQSKYVELEQQGQTMNEALRNMKLQELASLEQNVQAFSQEAEQEVMQLGQKLQNDLMQLEVKRNNEISTKLKTLLAEYNQDYGFSFILAHSDEAGGILLGNPALDITKDIVAGLNEVYDAQKAAEEEAKAENK